MEMNEKMKGKYRWLAGVTIIILVLSIFVVNYRDRNISIEIQREDIAYIVGYCRGYGPRKLNYSEHSMMIDQVIQILSGEYTYQKIWSNDGKSGGGPYSIVFFSDDDEELYRVQYVDGYVAQEKTNTSKYYLYEKNNDHVLLDDFEEYLDLYGESR